MDMPYTFHDGITLPTGSRIAFPILAIQTDPDNYDDALLFNGYRFVQRGEDEKIEKSITSSSTITPKFLP